MAHPLRQTLTQIGAFTARPTAFLIVGVYALLWLLLDRETLNWASLMVYGPSTPR
jgi:hypothetical protein